MTPTNFSFPKSERLCSHTLIEELFTKGSSFVCYPYRVVYLVTPLTGGVSLQVLFSVSKKRFKRAVHRNLLKRRSREAYRLNRGELMDYLSENNQQIAFALVYVSSEQLSYTVLERGMKKALKKLQGKLLGKDDVIRNEIN
jgi:ribonuclease P protein component